MISAVKRYTIPTSLTEVGWRNLIKIRPKTLLSSNSKLAKDGIWNLSMPAMAASVVQDSQLKIINTCPSAGTCKAVCYASQGCYVFKNVMVKHTRNLQYLLDDPFSFAEDLDREIKRKRHLKFVRFNDSGDFFSPGYWAVAKQVIESNPAIKFYAYTKMVSFFKGLSDLPPNFHVIYSYGGKEDDLIDPNKDRHAVIFPNRRLLRELGYSDGTHTDRLACSGKFFKIGLVVHGNWLAMDRFRKAADRSLPRQELTSHVQ